MRYQVLIDSKGKIAAAVPIAAYERATSAPTFAGFAQEAKATVREVELAASEQDPLKLFQTLQKLTGKAQPGSAAARPRAKRRAPKAR
jgi:hypothetical protein